MLPLRRRKKEAEELLQTTVKFWHNWLSGCTYHGRWRDQVHRSALALKLLTFEPTGAIVAAPTTSLPEVIGGVRNWDYRYTWMRDAAFTVYAFLRIGFREEAAAFLGWLEDYASKHARRNAPRPLMFTVEGDTHIPELTLDHWEGYRGSAPVRIGNAAGLAISRRHLWRVDGRHVSLNKYVSPISVRYVGKDPQSDGVDLRELAAAGRRNLGDAESRRNISSIRRS